ncbi:MAG: 4-(cytidine 5'-diphospho)-2-C-methyl-D-erythritol kinase [bacterium]
MAIEGETLRLSSPAKLNLYLEVRGKRRDGYHEICLLNTAIDLADEVHLQPVGDHIKIECDHPGVPAGEDNLCIRAARAFFQRCPHHKQGLIIRIKKRTPVAGGLAGGSSNAAAVLYGLNLLAGSELSLQELRSLGGRLGSDVPFFLFRSPAWVKGRGEILEPAPSCPPWSYVVVSFNFGVSASRAYAGWDLTRHQKPDMVNPTCPKEVPFRPEKFKNDLEPVVAGWFPLIGEVREALFGLGSLASLMSGSGPTVFGIFDNEESARHAARQIGDRSDIEAVVSRSLEGTIIKQLV